MAPGGRRLGSFLISTLVDVLRVLDATPAPRGRERSAATALRDWCAARWPEIGWTAQPYGVDGANLVASCSPGPLLYSHLDTSLDGASADADADAAVTGRLDPVGGLTVDGDRAEGFGLGVARGPAAAALLGFATARRGQLLLAGSGTHRRGGDAEGVRAYLASGAAPSAAIVAKGGPPSVLWEEPGAAYVRIRVAGRYGAALAPASAEPIGGVATHAGVLLAAISTWRAEYLRRRPPVGQVGPQAGLGAIRAGWPEKPDLLPASLVADLYVVTIPGEDGAQLGEEIAASVGEALTATALAAARIEVSVEVVHAAAATPAGAPIVAAARRAWTDEFGAAPAPVTGWTGSTDGVVFRAQGIDTVRLGPAAARSADDPRRDVVELAQLAAFSRVYAALLNA